MAAPDGSQTLGLSDTIRSALRRPVKLPAIAPVELNRFQKTVKIINGKFALAATAKASDTRKATFKDCANNARMMERMATPIEAKRAAFTCSRSLAFPLRIIWL